MAGGTKTRRAALWVTTPLALAACGPAPGPAPEGPNLLLLSIDTLRADHLGFHGYGRPTSPRLDAFADTAVVFENAKASASWTLPGLASLFTSTYTTTNGCWTLGSRLDESFFTLPERLTAAGYDSAAVASHLFCTPRFGLSQGFVHTDFELANASEDPEKATTSHRIADRGIRFLEQKAAAPDGKPWLLWLHFFDPHGDYLPQEGFTERFVAEGQPPGLVDLYDGEIAFTDFHVGRVLDALAATGQASETLVLLVADHGEEFFDHGGIEHGKTLFAEQLHVPLVLRVPGRAPRRVPDLVRTVDVLPTLLELCGLPPAVDLEGRSLVPLLDGVGTAPGPAYAELGMAASKQLASVQEGRWKLIRRMDGGGTLLFDLEADPGERDDLSTAHPEVVRRLEERLAAVRAEARRRAAAYGRSRAALPPDVEQDLGQLGYTGGDEE